MGQGEVLRVVEAGEGVTIREIAGRLKVSNSTVWQSLKRLERGGFIRVERPKQGGKYLPFIIYSKSGCGRKEDDG